MSDTSSQNPTNQTMPEVNFFAATNFRNQNRKFGIKLDDRRRHMYVVGKTGMGKTTLLENMVLNDIYAGHGIGLVDPHGDFAEKIIDYIPPHRINDVVYFNPADINFPIGFNILETIRPEQKHLVASGLMGVFKKIWPDVWSARMEYILNNTILALLDFPGTTLLGINRMLADEEYRNRVVSVSKDPVVKAFWQTEFANYTEKFRTEAVSPIQNKIGQFLSASVIRNIVAQVKSRINIREIMDKRQIFIMNLSKGRIGEDNSRLLGGMLITRLQLAAMERVDMPERERKDFFLYVDEFQNFATESFANILSEARKYRLDLIMAHQYMEQLDETVLAAVIGNVGTMVTFRVGSSDAEILAKEFTPTFVEEDLVNLPKFHIYLKLMIDGVASRPFSALTLSPIATSTASTEKVVRVSRERYATSRDKIEEKIMRWSGMVPMTEEEAAAMDVDDDEIMFKHDAPKPPAPAAPPAPKSASQPPAHKPTLQPTVRPASPPPAPATHVNSTPHSAPNQGGRNQSQGGDGDRKKRKRKRGGGGGGQNPPAGGHTETVMLVDPNQRGISLSQAVGSPKQQEIKPRIENQHNEPEQRVVNSAKIEEAFGLPSQPKPTPIAPPSDHVSSIQRPEEKSEPRVENTSQTLPPLDLGFIPPKVEPRIEPAPQVAEPQSLKAEPPKPEPRPESVKTEPTVPQTPSTRSSAPQTLQQGRVQRLDE